MFRPLFVATFVSVALADQQGEPSNPCLGQSGCREAKNQEELNVWLKGRTKQSDFVPAAFRKYAKSQNGDKSDAQYQKGWEEIQKMGGAAKALNLNAVSPANDQATSGLTQADYMKKYAGDYTKQYGGSKNAAGGQKKDVQADYMKKYAGDYMKQYGSSKSTEGDKYKQYMKQYQSNGGSNLCKAESGCREATTQQQLEAWLAGRHKTQSEFVPAAFKKYAKAQNDKSSEQQYRKGWEELQKEKGLNLNANPPTKDDAQVQNSKNLDGGYAKYQEDSMDLDSSKANLAEKVESSLFDTKSSVVFFAWGTGALVFMYGKFRNRFVVDSAQLLGYSQYEHNVHHPNVIAQYEPM